MTINPIISLFVAIPIFIIVMIFNILFTYGPRKITRAIILVLLFIVNLRIMVYTDNVYTYTNNLDLIFCFDNTLSMGAKDGTEYTRFDRAKTDVEYIVDKIPGSYYSLISYNDVSYLRIPLTKDASSFKASLKTMRIPNLTYANGTDITIFKSNLEEVLASSSSKPGRIRIVFVIGDGEITADGKKQDLSRLKEYISNGAVLGYGDPKGSYMEVETWQGSGKYDYVKDKNGSPAVTKLDEQNLELISDELGVKYIHMEKTSQLDELIADINKSLEMNEKTKVYSYGDTYYFASIVILILLGVELFLDRREYL